MRLRTVLTVAACLPLAFPVVVCGAALAGISAPLVALYFAYAVFFRGPKIENGPYSDIDY
jgi:hypothetical protein